MTADQEFFLNIVSAALKNRRVFCENRNEEFWKNEGTVSWGNIKKLARQQAVEALINDYMLTWETEFMPPEEQQILERQTVMAAMMYYRMADFVFDMLDMMKQQGVCGCILKGIGMAGYYPKEELRKTGDIDLYLPVRKEFEAFCRHLKEQGFEEEKSITDHHRSYYCVRDGARFELEVHIKPINNKGNAAFHKTVDQIFAPFTKEEERKFSGADTILGKVPVLLPEENAFYLLLHMLQHFLSGGMGIRLLCDWVLFWQKETISPERFLSFVKQSKIEGFAYLVTGVCISYLGLPKECVPWMEHHMPKQETMESLLEDMFLGGEFGECDTSRMLITVEKPSVRVYFKELHRQMRLRFQKAGKIPLLWPVLWVAAGIIFMYNNKHLRNTSVADVMKSTKERGKMLEELRLFQDWEENGGK